MLNHVLAYLRNYFVVGCKSGTFEVKSGSIELPFLQAEQYFSISGSVFNDGVYKYPAEGMRDETFRGTVYALAIPQSLLELVAEIEKWQETNGKYAESPYQSESFGGYSYTIKSGADGVGVSWQSAFAKRLSIWRKI